MQNLKSEVKIDVLLIENKLLNLDPIEIEQLSDTFEA